MKLNKGLVCFMLALATLTAYMHAAPGCQDNSAHLRKTSGDYKKWHYVACSCPCESRYTMQPDGHCAECKHLRLHTPITQVHTDPTKIINTAGLKLYAQKRAHAQQ